MKIAFFPLLLPLTGYLILLAKASSPVESSQPPNVSATPASASAATGPPTSSSPSCVLNENDQSSTLEMSFTETDSGTKEPLGVHFAHEMPKPGNGNNSVQSSMSLKIVHGSDTVFKTDRSLSSDGSVNVVLDWMPSTDKSHTASFTVDSSNLTTGTVDSKPISPISLNHTNSTSTLQRRAQPLLQVAPPPHLNISSSQIQNMLQRGLQACESKIQSLRNQPPLLNNTQAATPSLLPRQASPRDFGHFSPQTRSAFLCQTCRISATWGVDAAEGACIASTCLWTFGVGCIVCHREAAKLIRSAYKACYKSSACCPVGCGAYDEHLGTCCDDGESCLDSKKALCCGKGKTPCVGHTCCGEGQSCVSSGRWTGQCCPKGSVPWSGGSLCCVSDKICGNQCCTTVDPTSTGFSLSLGYCADASKSLCCDNGKVAKDGICCAPDENNCGGKCCGSTCSADGQCEVTNDWCLSKGYLGSCQMQMYCGQQARNPGTVCLDNFCCAKKPKPPS